MSVFSPVPERLWQDAAQAPAAAELRIDFDRSARNHQAVPGAMPHLAPGVADCYPSPICRPDISTVGPDLRPRQSLADARSAAFFPFHGTASAVFWQAITNQNRGISSCSRSFPQPFSAQPLWPAACPRPHSVAWQAPLSARPSPMPLMKTWSPARPLARLRARPPAASSWAFRPARPATDHDLTAAPPRGPDLTPRPFRTAVRGGLFACHSAPARAD